MNKKETHFILIAGFLILVLYIFGALFIPQLPTKKSKIQTRISLSVTRFEPPHEEIKTIPINNKIIVEGIIETKKGDVILPVPLVECLLIYTKPSGELITKEMLTTMSGTFSDLFVPDLAGTWKVFAMWGGNDEFEGAQSDTVIFEVTP